jgi:hypothetical protein
MTDKDYCLSTFPPNIPSLAIMDAAEDNENGMQTQRLDILPITAISLHFPLRKSLTLSLSLTLSFSVL